MDESGRNWGVDLNLWKELSSFFNGLVVLVSRNWPNFGKVIQKLSKFYVESTKKPVMYLMNQEVAAPDVHRFVKTEYYIEKPWPTRLIMRRKLQEDGPFLEKKSISHQTVARRLTEINLSASIAARKPLLRSYNIQRRLAWAKVHKDWTKEKWRRVIFSDESPFCVFQRHTLLVAHSREISLKYQVRYLCARTE